MNKPYSFKDHTADLRLKASGKNLKEILQNALFGLVELVKGEYGYIGQKELEKKFETRSISPEALIVDFLNEALFVMQTSKQVVKRVEFEDLKKNFVKGKFYLAKTAGFAKDVKAVTYHNLKLKRNKKKGIETTIVLDI